MGVWSATWEAENRSDLCSILSFFSVVSVRSSVKSLSDGTKFNFLTSCAEINSSNEDGFDLIMRENITINYPSIVSDTNLTSTTVILVPGSYSIIYFYFDAFQWQQRNFSFFQFFVYECLLETQSPLQFASHS
jgi:hypothetical protein